MISPEGRPLRVANIIEEARWSGPQNRIVDVAKHLRHMGIETIVILPAKDNQIFVKNLEELDIEYNVLKLHKLTRSGSGLLSFLIHFPGDILNVRKAIKESGADLVHCNSAGQWKGIIASKLAGVPAIWHLNDTNMPKMVRLLFRPLSKLATGFIPAAQRVAEYYLTDRLSAKPRILIQAPVDCQRYDPASVTADELTAQMPGIKIGCIGNVNADKDILTYVQMARLLRDKLGNQVSCFQIGGLFDSQKKYLSKVQALNEQEGDELVSFLGAKKDVHPYLRATDIYVCSSRFEASPISVWEAMAMGLPIVATDVGDIARMNEQGDFARVVPTQDHVALASAVKELVSSPGERQRLGANARKYALKNLDINVCGLKHALAYRKILEAREQVPPPLCGAKGGPL